MEPLSETTSISEQTYRLEFTGSASEYFRIWIINVFLTVVTLGIYNAWAKVRTRRYFYAHTTLDGHAFDYLANPVAILKGNLIVAAGLILFVVSQQFVPELNGVVVLGFYAVMPYLIYKSLRFRAHNSAYRNIRMHFHGLVRESYRIYFWWSLLIPFTLGLIFPYIVYRKKKYVFDHIAYGTTRSRFNGTPGAFYYIYLAVFGLSILGIAITVALSGMLSSILGESGPETPTVIMTLVALVYLGIIFIAALIQQYIYTQSSNYGWNHSTLGHVRFHSSLKTWPLVGIRMTNLLAIICSLGLLIPWARIRRTRYILDHLHLIVTGDLDHFTADQGTDDHALGDVSADFFDIEVGL
ncbi:YjgN family protein [Candidatus Entotheonella palauensis]|uniref:YjgN family protein n=1 Tax=Candidatus Entotheonella palauensis TaxID=93172 RepID=UPI000B7D19D5|nr:YjgN family protein [Candidatus Entotheonella palauensis]